MQDSLERLWEVVGGHKELKRKTSTRPYRQIVDELLNQEQEPSFYRMHRKLTGAHSTPTTPAGQGRIDAMP